MCLRRSGDFSSARLLEVLLGSSSGGSTLRVRDRRAGKAAGWGRCNVQCAHGRDEGGGGSGRGIYRDLETVSAGRQGSLPSRCPMRTGAAITCVQLGLPWWPRRQSAHLCTSGTGELPSKARTARTEVLKEGQRPVSPDAGEDTCRFVDGPLRVCCATGKTSVRRGRRTRGAEMRARLLRGGGVRASSSQALGFRSAATKGDREHRPFARRDFADSSVGAIREPGWGEFTVATHPHRRISGTAIRANRMQPLRSGTVGADVGACRRECGMQTQCWLCEGIPVGPTAHFEPGVGFRHRRLPADHQISFDCVWEHAEGGRMYLGAS